MRLVNRQTLQQPAFLVLFQRMRNCPLNDHLQIRFPKRFFYHWKQYIPDALVIAAADTLSQPASEGLGPVEISQLVLERTLNKSNDFGSVDSACELPDNVPHNFNDRFEMILV